MMTMIDKKRIILIFLLLTGLGIGLISFNRRHHYSVCVIRSGQGWGYNILKGRKIIIHQPYIPCFEGHITFEDKNAALRTGNLILEKLNNNQSPRININELKPILNAKND